MKILYFLTLILIPSRLNALSIQQNGVQQTIAAAETFSSSVTFKSNTNIFVSTAMAIGMSTSTAQTSWFGCSTSSISLTTNGFAPISVNLNGDAKNTTTNDGCNINILQDGVFFNGQTTAKAAISFQTQVGGDTDYVSYHALVPAPSAASHTYCFGMYATTGGTCTFSVNSFINFDVEEVR